MHTPTPNSAGFKRQVVFRIGSDEWPLLEAAAQQHGSIQAAVLAGLHALTTTSPNPPDRPASAPKPSPTRQASPPRETPAVQSPEDPDEEIRAREAARLLGLKTSTVNGYIRSGRIPGRYDGPPTWQGWVATRAAIHHYQRTRQA